jgi:hypothetical protein
LSDPGSFLGDEAPGSKRYLTEELAHEANSSGDSLDRHDCDPFLCGQNAPSEYVVYPAFVSNGQASVFVRLVWNPGTELESAQDVKVALQLVDREWRINSVCCGEGQERAEGMQARQSPPTYWQVFQEDEYGFQIQYPMDWSVREMRADATEDPATQCVLGFGFLGWENCPPLVSVQVGAGSPEEMSRWPVAEDQCEATVISGCTVLVGTGAQGEEYYIFEHPANGGLRVAVCDCTGDVGNCELKKTVSWILSSFTFTQPEP